MFGSKGEMVKEERGRGDKANRTLFKRIMQGQSINDEDLLQLRRKDGFKKLLGYIIHST